MRWTRPKGRATCSKTARARKKPNDRQRDDIDPAAAFPEPGHPHWHRLQVRCGKRGIDDGAPVRAVLTVADGDSRYRGEPLPARVRPADPVAAAEAVFASLSRRRTVRDFSDRPVPEAAIRAAVAAAGRAPSGANQQPWHFVAIRDANMKAAIRAAAEEEERAFYDGQAGRDWLDALAPIGTDADKPHLTDAPWLIVIFAQRHGVDGVGNRVKHYYVPESVGIACGFLIAALHEAGLDCLTHTPAPMGFLRDICDRPGHEKPMMILAVGYAAADAQVPVHAGRKKVLDDILTIR